MNIPQKYLTALISSLLLIGLGSCTPPPSNLGSNNSLQNPTPSNSVSPTAKPSPDESEGKTVTGSQPFNASSQNTVNVTVYEADSQCETVLPKKVAVPADQQLEAAVGKVLEKYDTGDFDLAGYRVNVEPATGVATVDFRVAPDSKRKLVSLSSCEQFALFNSLNKTLTSNPDWKIKIVRFTEQGKEILL